MWKTCRSPRSSGVVGIVAGGPVRIAAGVVTGTAQWCGVSRIRAGLVAERPRVIELTCSRHYCCQCRRYFNVHTSHAGPAKRHYTHRVISVAVRLVVELVEDGLPYRAASWHLWRDHRVFVPFSTIQNRVEVGEKKGGGPRRRPVSGRRTGSFFGIHRGR